MAQNANIRQALRRAAQMAQRVLQWWLDELRHLIPSRVRQVLSADPITLQIVLDDNGIDVQQIRIKGLSNAEHPCLGPGNRQSAIAWVAKRRRYWGSLMRVDVAVPASRCLIRHRNVPVAAVERIRDVLALEIERTTPFGIENVRQAWRLIGPTPFDDTSMQVVHVIAKRGLIDPLLAEARSAGVPIAVVDVVSSEGDRMGFNLLSPGEVPRSLAGRLNWAIGIATAFLVLVSGAMAVVALQRQDHALAQLEVEINAARKEAQAIRKSVQDSDSLAERIGLLRLRRADSVRLIALWEEVTRLLPDTAWLTDVRVENDVLVIDGYARSASELVGIIAASPMFSGVALSAPVIREEQRASERFQIRMKIESAGTGGIRKGERP